MSIFSGWDMQSLRALREAVTASPQGLAALFIMGLVGVGAIGIVVHVVSGRIAGFMTHVQEEEEAARQEELQEEAERAAEAANSEGEPLTTDQIAETDDTMQPDLEDGEGEK